MCCDTHVNSPTVPCCIDVNVILITNVLDTGIFSIEVNNSLGWMPVSFVDGKSTLF